MRGTPQVSWFAQHHVSVPRRLFLKNRVLVLVPWSVYIWSDSLNVFSKSFPKANNSGRLSDVTYYSQLICTCRDWGHEDNQAVLPKDTKVFLFPAMTGDRSSLIYIVHDFFSQWHQTSVILKNKLILSLFFWKTTNHLTLHCWVISWPLHYNSVFVPVSFYIFSNLRLMEDWNC